MTTANKITILRILLIPFFVVELIYYVETGNEIHRLVAILSFAIAAILDGVDGYIARHYNQISELGKILDPLADKLLLVSGIVALSFNHGTFLGQIPLWLTGTIIGRDFLILIGMVVIHLTVGKVVVRPRIHRQMRDRAANGRRHLDFIKMGRRPRRALAQNLGAGRGGFHRSFGILYIWDGVKQLGSHPASSPTKT
jgi:CDP-diacylglycerol--glycerol-3-phosphate 3-phosphatidyltransferase